MHGWSESDGVVGVERGVRFFGSWMVRLFPGSLEPSGISSQPLLFADSPFLRFACASGKRGTGDTVIKLCAASCLVDQWTQSLRRIE